MTICKCSSDICQVTFSNIFFSREKCQNTKDYRIILANKLRNYESIYKMTHVQLYPQEPSFVFPASYGFQYFCHHWSQHPYNFHFLQHIGLGCCGIGTQDWSNCQPGHKLPDRYVYSDRIRRICTPCYLRNQYRIS